MSRRIGLLPVAYTAHTADESGVDCTNSPGVKTFSCIISESARRDRMTCDSLLERGEFTTVIIRNHLTCCKLPKAIFF